MPQRASDEQPIYRDHSATPHSAWVDVDLGAVRRNAAALYGRARLPYVAMVKADAYGLGMVPVARALGAKFGEEGSAVGGSAPWVGPQEVPWGLGVATLAEASLLRASGYGGRILCTTPLTATELADAVPLAVRPALHRAADIALWYARAGQAWHLSIDTGMSRAGLHWRDIATLLPSVQARAPEGVFTHFHSAELVDGSRERQERRFAECLRALGEALPSSILIHSDNSAAIAMRDPSHSKYPMHLVRPGIGLYGASVPKGFPIEQVVHLRARVVDVREVEAGESVSYGALYRAAGSRTIATVALGYADGYRRALSNCGEALLHGHRVPVVGAVTMDMTMIDVTEVAGRCRLGDVATFMGHDGALRLTSDEVAARASLSPYELLTGLRLRLPRVYYST